MSTTWTDGHFVAGDVVLDFANTVYRRWPDVGADLLDDTQALTDWLQRAGLLAPGVDASGTTLSHARNLRSHCWTVFDAQRDGRDLPSDALTGFLTTAKRGIDAATVHADGQMSAQSADGALSVLALQAITLAAQPPPRQIRACDRCGWFFVDTSRGRRRRWCSMQTCGNQAKAARHRASDTP